MKANDRVEIKDEIWNRNFHIGKSSRRRKQKIFRVDFFIPNMENKMVKLKNDDGSLSTNIVSVSELNKIV